MINLDKAKEAFDKKFPDWNALVDRDLTEEDTRKQVVDYILEHVLGWLDADTYREPHSPTGYSDYVLKSGVRNMMVVEAKKVSHLLLSTAKPTSSAYKIHGPAFRDAQNELRQTRKYAGDHSVAYAVLTSGLQWIGFLAYRTDGSDPSTHQAYVFPSLQSIKDDFASFYDLFSKEGVQSRLMDAYILEAEGNSVRHAEELTTATPSTKLRMLNRSDMANDLDRIFKSFFSEMSGEKDPELLAKCFVETNESRDADANLEKITRHLTNHIQATISSSGSKLEDAIRMVLETKVGEFVLLVGNKGAGKSTFTDRFFRFVLADDLRAQCLQVRVDVGPWHGEGTLQSWVAKQLVAVIEREMFKGKNPTYEQLQGAFYREYERWMYGEFKNLYEHDKIAFKNKFGEYINDLRLKEPVQYAVRLLQRCVSNEQLVPCLVFDNTDHHSKEVQDAVFLLAQSIHREVFSLVIVPITDQTLWQLNKSGPMQSFPSKSFYLPVPSTKEVLTRRVGFLKMKLGNNDKESKEYFLSKGIRLGIKDITAFAATLEEVFIGEDFVSRMISWLSNHDIRRSLQLTKSVVSSPYVKIEDLLKAYIAEGDCHLPPRSMERAIVRGDYSYFSQEHSNFVLNLFEVFADDVSSPLNRMSILQYFLDRSAIAKDIMSQHATVIDVERYFEVMGIPARVARRELQVLLNVRLLEPYDPTEISVYEDQLLRVTSSGRMHFELAMQNANYLQDMALVTPMRNSVQLDSIRSTSNKKMTGADWWSMEKSFAQYCVEQDALFITVPGLDAYRGQRIFRTEFAKKWG